MSLDVSIVTINSADLSNIFIVNFWSIFYPGKTELFSLGKYTSFVHQDSVCVKSKMKYQETLIFVLLQITPFLDPGSAGCLMVLLLPIRLFFCLRLFLLFFFLAVCLLPIWVVIVKKCMPDFWKILFSPIYNGQGQKWPKSKVVVVF